MDNTHNLLRLQDTPRCILKYSSTWAEREKGEKTPRRCCCCCWHLSACFDWCPICLLFLLEAQFQFRSVCWQISSAQTRQQWISCEVVCLNHSGRNVRTLFARSHKIEGNCKLSRQAETLEGTLEESRWLTGCQTLPPCGETCWPCSRMSFVNASVITPSNTVLPFCLTLNGFKSSWFH